MTFSAGEIDKAKELKKLGFPARPGSTRGPWRPQKGHYLHARHCPEGCLEVSPHVFLVIDDSQDLADSIWLPTWDDLLEVAKAYEISFSFMTDYLHRKRFADRNEREGLYQLFIEKWR